MTQTGTAPQSTTPETTDATPPRRLWLLPVIALGLLCQALVILWIVHSEVPGKVFISSWSVSMPGILILALFLLLGLFFRGKVRQALFTQRPLLLVYIMAAVSGVLTGYGSFQAMMPTLGAVVWRASAVNRWERFWGALPDWLVPKGIDVHKGMFTGEAVVPWNAWLLPLVCWGAFLLALYGAMLFLSAILSRHWIHGERLAFPVAQLPLEITGEQNGLFRNRLFWIGFVIPVVLESLLALNYYYPSVPAMPMKHRNFQPEWFPERPFSVMNPFYWGWTPFIVGFAYFAPTDVSFSVWFFNLFGQAQKVYGAMTGLDAAGAGGPNSTFPFVEEQSTGAFLAFAAAALWRSWPAIRQAWRGRRRSGPDEDPAVMGWSVAGLAVCCLFVVLFLWFVGLPVWIGTALLAIILLVGVTLSRIRAEAGPAWVFGPNRDPTRVLVVGVGSNTFTEPQIAQLSLFRWISRDVRFIPMPFHMESLKIADAAGISRRTVIPLILLATAFGIAFGFYAVLHLSYDLGWGTGKTYGGAASGMASWTQADTWAKNPLPWDDVGLPWVAGGGAFCLFLMKMRSLFVWWPFHPIGYVMAETGAGRSFWFHYLLAWALKLLVLRYGGHRLYISSIPFVISFILGDILTQTVWSAGAVILGIPVYQFIS